MVCYFKGFRYGGILIMGFFNNYDSVVIISLGFVCILIGVIVYSIENNISALYFTSGFGIGWILLGLNLKNYNLIEK